jgi:hypothetical protein
MQEMTQPPPRDPDAHHAVPPGRRGAGLPSEAALPDALGDLADSARPEDHPEAAALIEAHLAQRGQRTRPQKLAALREAVQAGRQAPPPRTGGGKLALRHTLDRMDEQKTNLKLASLAASIQELVPDTKALGALAREGTKQVIMNQLNPVMAATMAAAESANRLKHLRRWQELGGRERMIHVTGLMASLADIVGALTPPPASIAAQAMGAGMSLMMIASEGSEGVTKLAPPRPPAAPEQKKGTGKLGEWGDNLSHNLLDRWQTFTARVEKKLPPRRPPPD